LESHAALRARWLANGARWWDCGLPEPLVWSPEVQLGNIGYSVTAAERRAIAAARLNV
jgi:hypothetical protein